MNSKTHNTIKEREYFKHIEKYIGEQIVQNVLTEETTFEKEVENFYGMHSYRGGRITGSGEDFDKEDKTKFNKKPNKLIEIVFPFSEEEINDKRLTYDSARQDYKYSKKITPKKVGEIALFTGSLLGILGGTVYSLVNPLIGIPTAIVSGYTHVKMIKNGPSDHPKDQGGYVEFNKFLKASKVADSFIQEKYRPAFIRQKLK